VNSFYLNIYLPSRVEQPKQTL